MDPSERLDATFVALADPTRRAILARLKNGDATVNELAAPFDISQPAISKHLKILERAGLVSRSNVGTSRPVRIEAGPMREAVDWLEKYREFWEKSYQRLDALLEILQTPINTDKPSKKKQRKDDNA
jgi:DNA-binding transcriptional ArsR family regulator